MQAKKNKTKRKVKKTENILFRTKKILTSNKLGNTKITSNGAKARCEKPK